MPVLTFSLSPRRYTKVGPDDDNRSTPGLLFFSPPPFCKVKKKMLYQCPAALDLFVHALLSIIHQTAPF